MSNTVKILFQVLCTAALLIPWFQPGPVENVDSTQIEWPEEFEGYPLIQLPLSEKEQQFVRTFPGSIGRFTDGRREIIFRRVTTITRQLHPSADCFKGMGYQVTPEPIAVDRRGKHWGCFSAGAEGSHLRVCERIYDEAGQSYHDTSTWFWAAALGKTDGPWWAVTVAS